MSDETWDEETIVPTLATAALQRDKTWKDHQAAVQQEQRIRTIIAEVAHGRAASEFLRRVANGGRIVSTAALSPEAIAAAHAENRILVTPDGLGYVHDGIHPSPTRHLHPDTEALVKAHLRNVEESLLEMLTATGERLDALALRIAGVGRRNNESDEAYRRRTLEELRRAGTAQ